MQRKVRGQFNLWLNRLQSYIQFFSDHSQHMNKMYKCYNNDAKCLVAALSVLKQEIEWQLWKGGPLQLFHNLFCNVINIFRSHIHTLQIHSKGQILLDFMPAGNYASRSFVEFQSIFSFHQICSNRIGWLL